MSDYIKREDAIRQIVKTSAQNELDIHAIGTVIYILSEMDSADVVEVVRKPIKGYEEHYEVDQFGRVYSVDRIVHVDDNGREYDKPLLLQLRREGRHMSKKRGTNVPDQPTVPPMPKKRRYIDESILVEKLHVGEWLPTISRSVLVNCVLPTIPIADVRENVRGEWLSKNLDNFRKYEVICSVCGARFIGNYDAYDEPYDFNFCPNCGADMRGDNNGKRNDS